MPAIRRTNFSWSRPIPTWFRSYTNSSLHRQDIYPVPLPLTFPLDTTRMSPEASSPEYRNQDLTPPPQLKLICSWKKAKDAISLLRGSVIGLDVEYVQKKGCASRPALLQLCDDKLVLLIQFHNGMSATLPDSIVRLLCEPKIIKVGVGIHNDCVNLVRTYKDQFLSRKDSVVGAPRALLELADLAHHIGVSRPLHGQVPGPSLAGMCETYVGKRLNKSANCHRGSWRGQLSEKQMNYAANDVTASLQAYRELSRGAEATHKRLNMAQLCQHIDVAHVCRKASHAENSK